MKANLALFSTFVSLRKKYYEFILILKQINISIFYIRKTTFVSCLSQPSDVLTEWLKLMNLVVYLSFCLERGGKLKQIKSDWTVLQTFLDWKPYRQK